ERDRRRRERLAGPLLEQAAVERHRRDRRRGGWDTRVARAGRARLRAARPPPVQRGGIDGPGGGSVGRGAPVGRWLCRADRTGGGRPGGPRDDDQGDPAGGHWSSDGVIVARQMPSWGDGLRPRTT